MLIRRYVKNILLVFAAVWCEAAKSRGRPAKKKPLLRQPLPKKKHPASVPKKSPRPSFRPFHGIELSANVSTLPFYEADACRRWLRSQPKVKDSIGPTEGSTEWCRGWPLLFAAHGIVPVVTYRKTTNLSTTFQVLDCNLRGKMERLSMIWTFVDPSAARDAVATRTVIDENRLRIDWRAPKPGHYKIEARLQYFDDICRNDLLYLGAFQRRKTTFLSPRCDELSMLHQEPLDVQNSDSFPLPKDDNNEQCRDGETADGRWLAEPREGSNNATAFMFEKPMALLKGSMQSINGLRGDRWYFDRPHCTYHYFSPQEASACFLKEEKPPIILFVGDSVVRNLNVVFVRALGGDADDTELKLRADLGGAFDVDQHLHVGYVFQWNHVDFNAKVLPNIKDKWLRQIKDHGSLIIIANFGAIHQQGDVCSGTFEKHLNADINVLRRLIAPAHLKLVLLTPSLTLGLREPTFSSSRASLTAEAMRHVAQRQQLKTNSSSFVAILDATNLTKTRIDDTTDGTHYQGSAIAAQALVLLNLLCQRPTLEDGGGSNNENTTLS